MKQVDQDRYQFTHNHNRLEFEFESDGPNGMIRKVIRFSPENSNGTTYFNLAFGPLNDENNKLDDKSVSNNKDTNKILATVAAAVVEFSEHFPDMPIFARGSSAARTRLYQIGISLHWEQIGTLFDVYGSKNTSWEPFQKNINYDAFLIYSKKN